MLNKATVLDPCYNSKQVVCQWEHFTFRMMHSRCSDRGISKWLGAFKTESRDIIRLRATPQRNQFPTTNGHLRAYPPRLSPMLQHLLTEEQSCKLCAFYRRTAALFNHYRGGVIVPVGNACSTEPTPSSFCCHTCVIFWYFSV